MGKRIRIRRQFEIEMNNYEDKKHPCYNCLVKGICTDRCDDFFTYDDYVLTIGHTLVNKENFCIVHKTADWPYSLKYNMNVFLDIKTDKFIKIIKNCEVDKFLKIGKYHLNRKEFIISNYYRKYGYQGSTASSSSSSTCYSTKSAKKNNIAFP